jgi:hypothetical protein
MVSKDALREIRLICPEAEEMAAGDLLYVYLPQLKLPIGCMPSVVDGLLCLKPRDGYPTRLFLSEPVSGKGNNWNIFHILDKAWHSWSWNNVPYMGRPAETLAQHLVALR